MKSITYSSLILASAFCSLSGQTLLYEYSFNDAANGANTVATGTAGGTAAFTNYVTTGSTSRQSADLRGVSGSGVSGIAGDYAFDNSGSTQMGGSGAANGANAGYGGMAANSGGASALDGQTSFTVSGWYYSSSTPGNFARLIEVGSVGVWFTDTDILLNVTLASGTEQFTSSDASLFTTDTWNFFAFTYNGVTGEAALYGGTDESEVALIVSTTLSSSTVSLNHSNMTIANSNFSGNQRPFDGMLDNYRVWGDSDASGALGLSALEAVRSSDIIPEPSTYALIVGSMAVVLITVRRRKLV